MAKKIRFKLALPDGTSASSLDELKEHFDLEVVIGYFKDGKLLTWLRDRYIEEEANAVAALDESAPDFQQRLCEIFNVEYSGETIDLEELKQRQERLKKLREYTDNEEYIKNIDTVAFDQEELADLLDEGYETIYLCGDRFTIPASLKGKTYIGINEPGVHISGKTAASWAELGITISGCAVDNPPIVAAHNSVECCKEDAVYMDDIESSVADNIYGELGRLTYIETKDYILYERSHMDDANLDGIYAINKKDGNSKCLLPLAKYPYPYCREIEKWLSYGNRIYTYFSKENYRSANVYILDAETGELTDMDLTIPDPSDACVANEYFFVYPHDNGKLTYVDLQLKKKYHLKNEDHRSNARLCTDKTLYFTDWESYRLMKYSFDNHKECAIAQLPTNYGCNAMAYYDNKIFMVLDEGEQSIGYVDLTSGQYKTVEDDIYGLENLTLKKYKDGWVFAKTDEECEIRYFDFKTLDTVMLATNCTYTTGGLFSLLSFTRGGRTYFQKIGNWIYFKQGDNRAKVSLDRPMEVELIGEPLKPSLFDGLL